MGRIKVEKHVCDLCGHEGHQQECILCKREFCLLCRKSTSFDIDVCNQCARRDDYNEIRDRFIDKFRRHAKLESKAISQLPKFKPKLCSKCEGAFRKLVTFRHNNHLYKTCSPCRDIVKKDGF